MPEERTNNVDEQNVGATRMRNERVCWMEMRETKGRRRDKKENEGTGGFSRRGFGMGMHDARSEITAFAGACYHGTLITSHYTRRAPLNCCVLYLHSY